MNKIQAFFNNLPEDIKAGFKKVVAEVKMEDAPAPTESKTYAETTLQDGTILKYTGEKLDVGSEVIIVTPEGEVPAPEGEHVLADGSTIVVAKEGELSIVKEVKPMEEMKKDAPTEAAFEAIKKEFDEFKAALLKEVEHLKSENEKLKVKASKTAAQLKDTVLVVEAMTEAPQDEPAKKPTSTPAVSKQEKMLQYLASKNKK